MAIPVTVDCIYVNGCSWTYGSELRDPGHPEFKSDFDQVHVAYRKKHTWSALLGQKYSLEVFNGSEAGAGNDRILRTTVHDIAKLKSQGRRPLVVIAWSHIQRFELPDNSEGTHWRSFVGPSGSVKNPSIIDEIFSSWTTDRTDLIKWMQAMITLDGFFKIHRIPYYSTIVFDTNRRILQQYETDRDLSPYYFGLTNWFNTTRHDIKNSLDLYLRQFPDVKYGAGLHPLERGQQYIADHLETKLEKLFTITRPK